MDTAKYESPEQKENRCAGLGKISSGLAFIGAGFTPLPAGGITGFMIIGAGLALEVYAKWDVGCH